MEAVEEQFIFFHGSRTSNISMDVEEEEEVPFPWT